MTQLITPIAIAFVGAPVWAGSVSHAHHTQPGIDPSLRRGAQAVPAVAAPSADRPNFVIIVVDDLGYGGIGAYGEKEIPTPNIDSLARDGVRFTAAYVASPLCAPSRAALLTGRHPARYGAFANPDPRSADPQNGLALGERTVAEILRDAGYATGVFGKWHLGFAPSLQPNHRGFHEFFGTLVGHAWALHTGESDTASSLYRNGEPAAEQGDWTELFTREAIAFIERNKGRPFFVYLPYTAVHAPSTAPEAYVSRFASIRAEKRRLHAAMLSALDDAIGELLECLDRNGLRENTLVVLLSDNGAPSPDGTFSNTSSNGPLRGFKQQLFEGGLRVPMLWRWPARLPAGREYDRPAVTMDVTATMISVAGHAAGPSPELDGVNLLPFLVGGSAGDAHECLYWVFPGWRAVRAGEWKLIQREGESLMLYNVEVDIGETRNLAESYPQVRDRLVARLLSVPAGPAPGRARAGRWSAWLGRGRRLLGWGVGGAGTAAVLAIGMWWRRHPHPGAIP